MTFGEKLRQYRKEKGLTQAELAKAAGLSLKTITNYENGSTYPHRREVYGVLAGLLGVDKNTLRNEGEDEAFVEAARRKYGPSGCRQARELVEEMGGLFAGGELSEEDMDGVMRTLQDYYWKAKEENRKYGRKKSAD